MNMPTVTKRRSAPLGNCGRLVTVAAPKCAHCGHAMAPKIYPGMPRVYTGADLLRLLDMAKATVDLAIADRH
jgi:hypothetical protein